MLPGKKQKLNARQISQVLTLIHTVTDFLNEAENYRSQNNGQKNDIPFPGTAAAKRA